MLLLTISFISLQSFAQWTEFVWDTITFEEPYEYLQIDTSSQNIWQIGEPSKIFLDSAYSGQKAILTDTLNYYPLNNNSYFDLKIGAFNYGGAYIHNVFIEIKHKFDTDTLKDGGFITVSYDNGLTWTNIINDISGFYDVTPHHDYEYENLYTENDTLFNGEFGFSGNSEGWITSKFAWYDIPVKSSTDFGGDTLIVRFNFISDNVESNNEGWMIDNIKLYSVDLGGLNKEIDSKETLKYRLSPNPMREKTTIELDDYRELEFAIFDTQSRIVKQNTYYNNETIVISRDELKSGVYFVKIKTDEGLVGVRKLIVQ